VRNSCRAPGSPSSATFQLPRSAGNYEDADVTIGEGRFGPYVLHRFAKQYIGAKG